MDFMAGWLLGYTQQGGLSVGEVYESFNKINNGDPKSWVDAFEENMRYQQKMADERLADSDTAGAAIKLLAVSQAARAAVSFCDPMSARAKRIMSAMEQSFQRHNELVGNGLVAHDFDYHGKKLPAYVTGQFVSGAPLLLIIGGGDSFREDLYFFGGRRAIELRYNVVLVDLPGQGKTPYQGLHFGQDTIDAVTVVLDQVEAMGPHGLVAAMAYSGGGYFACKAVEKEKRITALIASTPVVDMKQVVLEAIPSLLAADMTSWLSRTSMKLLAVMNKPSKVAFQKYAWQCGPNGIADFLAAMDATKPVDVENITIPVLGVVGLGEDPISAEQAKVVLNSVKRRYPASKLLLFPPESGADAHCQVNNLSWGQHFMFRWLKEIGIVTPIR
jgi:pimeloyl-ACP methyl ester carboxylesterase